MRFLTYNIKSGLQGGIDGLLEAMRDVGADVVGLLEVDRGTARAERRDQASELAAGLGLRHHVFAPAVPWEGGGEYGVALLSRHPIVEIRTWPLYVPTDESVDVSLREPRVVLSATIRGSQEPAMRVFVTHFGLDRRQRTVQARELGAAVQQAEIGTFVVVLADLNAGPGDPELVPLFEGLQDAHQRVPYEQRHTFPAGAADDEGIIVDYVLSSRELHVQQARIVADTKGASDHDLCVADVSAPRER